MAKKNPYTLPPGDDAMDDFTIHPDILRGGTPYPKVATGSTTRPSPGKTATRDPSAP